MIYTRMGSQVKLISKDGAWIVYEREDGSRGETLQNEFRADDGWDELEKAFALIPELKQKTKAEGL